MFDWIFSILLKWILSNWGGRIGIILGVVSSVFVFVVLIWGMFDSGNITIIVPIVLFFVIGVFGTVILGIVGSIIGKIVEFIIEKVKRA